MENITFEDFDAILNKLEIIYNKSHEIYKTFKIDLFDYEEDYHYIIDKLITITFKDEEIIDWFSWYCYENDFGKGDLTATYPNGDKIPLTTHKELYDFLKSLK